MPSDQPDDLSTDITSALDPVTFDLDAWINGVNPSVRAVTLYQRADLMGVIDELQRKLRVAEMVSDEDRGMNDATPDGVRREIEQVVRQFEASALVFKLEGRSQEVLERIAKRLKKQDVDEETIGLHQLADAIIEPKGVTPEFLRKLQAASEIQLVMLRNAMVSASAQPPAVDVPFSSRSSNGRKRERSS